ncbi:MAG TPA: prepilin-type N-terminal cleavage/methylation domain-containing protein [candidate division Zixibacteria bacterium]|nr:prepilin-type N-terminal cleavage/methylation domain-containing protein [candidate division Zixibacteria bacterium]
MKLISNNSGFSLLELTVAIIVIGLLMAVAMQSMTSVINDTRQAKTEREMELLAMSIAGDPDVTQDGGRIDFGYIGDIGAFPPNINALYSNPGGYSTWKGPYLPAGFTQDSTGLKTDEWGSAYNYSGGINITSTGSGTTVTKRIARASNDYLQNSIFGTVKDALDSLPGAIKKDSVDVKITIPNGTGSTLTKLYRPNASGTFTLDSIPVGMHPIRLIYTPNADTLFRYLTVYPRHKSSPVYKFSSAYFSGGGGSGPCDSSGTITLRPNGAGTITNLVTSGCASNWQCVDESVSDNDATRVARPSNSFATDIYNLEDPASTTCNFLTVTVRCFARHTQTQGEIMPTIYVNGTEYNGALQALTTSYAVYSQQWTVNPNSGTAWTITDITNLQAGVRLKGQNSNFAAYCTQVWVEATY